MSFAWKNNAKIQQLFKSAKKKTNIFKNLALSPQFNVQYTLIYKRANAKLTVENEWHSHSFCCNKIEQLFIKNHVIFDYNNEKIIYLQ